jgi:endonuclease/exonuclease/phosphatase family metal-dependent hydrolase
VEQISRFLQNANDLRSTKAPSEAQLCDSTVIVAGDFNICPEHSYDDGSQYRHLCRRFWNTGFNLVDAWHPGKSAPTINYETLDHIFIEQSAVVLAEKAVVKLANERGEGVADHLAIRLQLKF